MGEPHRRRSPRLASPAGPGPAARGRSERARSLAAAAPSPAGRGREAEALRGGDPSRHRPLAEEAPRGGGAEGAAAPPCWEGHARRSRTGAAAEGAPRGAPARQPGGTATEGLGDRFGERENPQACGGRGGVRRVLQRQVRRKTNVIEDAELENYVFVFRYTMTALSRPQRDSGKPISLHCSVVQTQLLQEDNVELWY
ncbi:translation initiation factor IF-2-like [Grus americana]|uniref:translation initiation factor IF-2-like n=1 Tax=Grus americana TaxID=9117 RepID=UPI002407FC76|nr:translation initiation factor IF-2-like [Grus americana]